MTAEHTSRPRLLCGSPACVSSSHATVAACDRVTLAQGHVLQGHSKSRLLVLVTLACAFAGTSLVRDSQLLALRLFYSTLEVPVKYFIMVVPRRAMQGEQLSGTTC